MKPSRERARVPCLSGIIPNSLCRFRANVLQMARKPCERAAPRHFSTPALRRTTQFESVSTRQSIRRLLGSLPRGYPSTPTELSRSQSTIMSMIRELWPHTARQMGSQQKLKREPSRTIMTVKQFPVITPIFAFGTVPTMQPSIDEVFNVSGAETEPSRCTRPGLNDRCHPTAIR